MQFRTSASRSALRRMDDRKTRTRRRALAEALEGRVLLSNSWKAAIGGDWDTPGNWSLGHVPTSTEDVAITIAGNYSVTHTSTTFENIHSLTFSAPLSFSAGGLTSVGTVTANNNLTLGYSTQLTCPSLAIGSGHIVQLGDAVGAASMTFNGSGAGRGISGTGQILCAGPSPSSDTINFVALPADKFTIAAGIKIHGAAANLFDGYGQAAIINSGTIAADAVAPAGQSFSASGFINNGTISASAGGSLSLNTFSNSAGKTISIVGGGKLTLGGAWTSAGVISENSSTLSLGGTFAQATIGTISRTGGTVDVSGTDDLGGGTLAFTAASGAWNLRGGTLKNGTLSFAGGASLLPTSSGGTLDTIKLAGDLLLPGATSITFANSLTLMSHNVTLGDAAGAATATFTGTGAQSLAGTGQIKFAVSSDYINVVAQAASPLTIAAGVTIHGPAGNISDAYGQLGIVNLGTISADAVAPAGQALTISGLLNKGTMSASAGGSMTINGFTNTAGKTISVVGGGTLTLGGTWSNAGIISENNSKLVLGGTITQADLGTINRTGGTIDLTGTVDVGGGTLAFTSASGPWNLRGGILKNATLTFAGANALVPTNSGGTLDNVKLGGDLLLPGGTSITVSNGLTLLSHNITMGDAVGSATIICSGSNPGQTITGTGQIIFGGSNPSGDYMNIVAQAASPFTFGAGVTVHGAAGNISDAYGQLGIVNLGTIAADVTPPPGQILTISGLANKGAVSVSNGASMTINTFTNAAGKTISSTSSGTGALTFGGAWSNAGIISENNSTVNLGGTFTQAGLGTFIRSGGSVNLTGVDDVGGGTLAFTAATGIWNLLGGTVKNGTLTFTGANQLLSTTSGGTLDKVKLGSDWTVRATTSVTIANGLTLLNHNLTLGDASGSALMTVSVSGSGQSLAGTGQIALAGSNPGSNYINFVALAASPFTIASGITIHGAAGNLSDAYSQQGIVNQGTITVDAVAPVSQSLSLSGFVNKGTMQVTAGKLTINGSFSNSGTLAAIGGDISVNIGMPSTFTNTGVINIAAGHTLNFNASAIPLTNGGGGVLTGTGTIAANVTNGGVVSPGPVAVAPASTVGTLHITGTYTQTASGSLKIEVASAASFDKLAVSGKATLAGLVDVYMVNAFKPAIGAKFAVLAAGSVTGNFTATDGTSLGGGVALSEAIAGTQAVLTAIKAPTDLTPPTFKPPVALSSASAGSAAVTFTLTFSDNIAINVSTITSSAIKVTNAALAFTQTATLVSVSKANNGTARSATFKITPPGGTLDFADNGVYTITLLAGIIKDTSGLPVAAGVLGTLTINLPKPK